MLQVKYYSNKSNAKRALAKIGAEVLAKADDVLVSDGEGQWGFDTGAVVELQKQLTKPVVKVVAPAKAKPAAKTEYRYDGNCPLCGSGNGATWHNEGVSLFCHVCSGVFSAKTGRRVNTGYTRENCNSGYTIEKNRPTQNGVTRPSSGTRTEEIWILCDKLFAAGNMTSAEVYKAAKEAGMNVNTVARQMAEWRKFHGISAK